MVNALFVYMEKSQPKTHALILFYTVVNNKGLLIKCEQGYNLDKNK